MPMDTPARGDCPGESSGRGRTHRHSRRRDRLARSGHDAGPQNWPQTDGVPSMAVLPGKVYVKTPVNIDPTKRYDEIFEVDVATHTVGTPASLDFNPATTAF